MAQQQHGRAALQWAIAAGALNASCVLVLLLNLITGNVYGQAALIAAGVLLFAGGVTGFQARRLWIRDRNTLR